MDNRNDPARTRPGKSLQACENGGWNRSGGSIAERAGPVVGVAAVPGACRVRNGAALVLSARPAAGRPVGPHGPLPRGARPRSFALAAAILRLPLGADRQSGS